jgi:hypothetical protein
MRYSQDNFKSYLHETQEYKYLKKNNDNNEIQHCLWDNDNLTFAFQNNQRIIDTPIPEQPQPIPANPCRFLYILVIN